MIFLYKMILLSSIVLYLFIFCFFMIKISKAKKQLDPENDSLKKTSFGYKASHIIAALLSLSPLLFLFKPYIQIAVCLCGSLGEFTVCKDRLKQLTKNA